MKNMLFDEKMDGTVHLAVGNSVYERGGVNESAIHWDIVKDLRTGGRIELDGRVVQQDGAWKLARVSIWRNRGLRALIAAQTVSRLGSQMTFLALPWFVLETTGSASRMGVVLAVELAPVGLFGIPSGALVGRLGARRTLLLCDAARVPLMCSVPLLHAAGVLSFPLLLVLVFLLGCFLGALHVGVATSSCRSWSARTSISSHRRTRRSRASSARPRFSARHRRDPDRTDRRDERAVRRRGDYLFAFVMVGVFVPARPRVAPSEASRGLLAGVRFLFQDRLLRIVVPTSLS